MVTIAMDDFLSDGILREDAFRAQVAEIDWSEYRDERVLIKGGAQVPVPTWAYLILTAHLTQVARQILYGEACAAVKVFNRGS